MDRTIHYSMAYREWNDLKDALIQEGYKIRSGVWDGVLDKGNHVLGQAFFHPNNVDLVTINPGFDNALMTLENRLRKSGRFMIPERSLVVTT